MVLNSQPRIETITGTLRATVQSSTMGLGSMELVTPQILMGNTFMDLIRRIRMVMVLIGIIGKDMNTL